MKRIAIVGAGMSGLSLAHLLSDQASVELFDKSRGVSGRMSTRYADPYQFDHGAQYFTARTNEFQAFLKPFVDSGVLEVWKPRLVSLQRGASPTLQEWSEPRYVPSPRMNAWCQALAEPLHVRLNTQISHLERSGSGWTLLSQDEQRFGPFDWVVCAIPAPQASKLLPAEFSHRGELEQVRMQGCFSLMLGYEKPLALEWDAATVEDSLLGWISVNSNKPGRPAGYSLLVQTTNEWAEKHLEEDRGLVQQKIMDELALQLGVDVSRASTVSVHRWRYADTKISAGSPFLLDSQNNLAACGDWCIRGKVEAAFTSGYSLSRALEQYW